MRMRYRIDRIRSLKDCLPFLAHHVLQFPELLYVGRRDKRTELLPREILGNWLVCAVLNYESESDEWTICTDPAGSDGILQDKKSGENWQTEHVMRKFDEKEQEEIEALVVKSIEAKQKKGAQYAWGKILIVFLEGSGKWFPNKLSRLIKRPLLFHNVWVFGRDATSKEHVYYVTKISNNSLMWKVHFDKKFTSWEVRRIR